MTHCDSPWISVFQSTLSLRRATVHFVQVRRGYLDFNPRSPCGERLGQVPPGSHRVDFNPRSPCGERPYAEAGKDAAEVFQSTLSLRRATCFSMAIYSQDPYFNPRSPCGERRPEFLVHPGALGISIHALLAESDETGDLHTVSDKHISIHALLAESDLGLLRFPPPATISIHALLAESDQKAFSKVSVPVDFNPRSPCGERQQIPPNWPYRFCLKCQFKDGEKSKKAKGSASAQASSPAYEKNKVRIPWGDFECFRFAPIK